MGGLMGGLGARGTMAALAARALVAGALAVGALAWPAVAAAKDPVAARTIRVGEVLSETDLKAEDASAAARVPDFVGLEARRAIYAGRPVVAGDLGPPTLVRRNAVVTMLYQDGALAIRAEARALDPGGEGEMVRVINLGSRQVVRAMVVGENTVEVTP